MFAVCIPFLLDYSQTFENLFRMVQVFMTHSSQGQDFLSPHKDLLFALGLGEEWASAALFLSLLEVMINEKLVQSGEDRSKVNNLSFQNKIKLLSEKAENKSVKINSLFVDSF